MCGIFGKINYLHKQKISESELINPINLMTHRGPDDEGIFVDRYIGLAVKRLKIIDLKTGHQPMFNETKDIAIVYNGEIYNYLELKKELETKHRFYTASDTEVIIHLYEEYGQHCLEKLNGMFSFAIWDLRKELLFIARDRIGIKPLFYSIQNGSLYFSSEIRALVSCNDIPKKIDEHALINYLSFYYVSSPWTIFKNIKRLPQGHYLFIKNSKIELKKYWDYEFKPENITEGEAIKQVQDVFLKSVQRHLQSDVPVGVFLSSGLDSSSIVATISKLGIKPKTYTIGYENQKSFNELKEARLVAKKYETEHHECILKPDDVCNFLPEIIKHLAEPHGDWTFIALYFLSKQSRPNMTVSISGAGGDELFAGYPTLIATKIAKFYKKFPKLFRDIVKFSVRLLPTSFERLSFDFKAKAFISGAELEPERAHLRFKEIFPEDERKKLLKIMSGYDPFEVYNQYLKTMSQPELLNKLMLLDLKVFHPDCTLHAMDMATMMNSQECRVPFLDIEMIELSRKIPINLKLHNLTTKYIIRKAFADYLPKEIIGMPKKGLAMPTSFWIRNELRNFITGVIDEAQKTNKDIFDFDYIKHIFNEHFQGKKDSTRQITCLISFFLWQKFYQ